MKKLLLLMLSLPIALASWGQSIVQSPKAGELNVGQVSLPRGNSWEDKHFREALERGRENQGWYVLVNEGKKVISGNDLIDYCIKHNYKYKKKYETKEVQKFGDFSTSVSKFYFIPSSVWPYYVFEWTDRTNTKSSSLKNKGSVWFFNPQKMQFVLLQDNALWSGEIVDGMIEGTGAGLWSADNQSFFYFNGTFHKGFPVGKATFREFNSGLNSWGRSPRETWSDGTKGQGPPFRTIEMGEMSEGLASFCYRDNGEDGKGSNNNLLWGFVDTKGMMAIAPQFSEVTKPFAGGRAEVLTSSNREIVIDKQGNSLGDTEKQKRLTAQQEALERQKEIERQKEEERRKIEERQRRIEQERLAAEHEKNRRERLRNAKPGDRIYYTAGFKHTESFLWWTISENHFDMRVTCFIEQNIDNGERLQVRVGDVSSSSSDHYKTPEIDGIKYHKGDVLWIKPLENRGWDF